jgi:hypothetical protein
MTVIDFALVPNLISYEQKDPGCGWCFGVNRQFMTCSNRTARYYDRSGDEQETEDCDHP